MRLLLVEDAPEIVEYLSEYLSVELCPVDHADGPAAAAAALDKTVYDLLLVDLALCGGNGFEVCAMAQKKQLPVIFLTASNSESDLIRGLDMGAEDYISKPFRPRELLARIRSVLRRSGRTQRLITDGPLQVDPEKADVQLGGVELSLSTLEYRLLLRFLGNKNRVLTRDELLQELWDAGGEYVNDNTLSVYIKRLREKLGDDAARPHIIQTVRGQGYRWGNLTC